MDENQDWNCCLIESLVFYGTHNQEHAQEDLSGLVDKKGEDDWIKNILITFRFERRSEVTKCGGVTQEHDRFCF